MCFIFAVFVAMEGNGPGLAGEARSGVWAGARAAARRRAGNRRLARMVFSITHTATEARAAVAGSGRSG